MCVCSRVRVRVRMCLCVCVFFNVKMDRVSHSLGELVVSRALSHLSF